MNYTVSLRKRGDKWSYQIFVGSKYHSSKSGFKTRADAKRAGDQAALKIKNPERNKNTFKEIADLYIKDGGKAESTQRTYNEWLKNLKPIWDTEITKITYLEVSTIITDYYVDHKYNTVKSLVGFGNSIFIFAHRKLKIDVESPFREITLRKHSNKVKREPRLFTLDEILKLIDNERDPDIRWLFVCAGLAGMRIAEARATRPATIDLKTKRVKIDKQRTSTSKVKDVMKSEGGARSIRMHDRMIEEYLKLPIPIKREDFLVQKFITSNTVTKAFERHGYPETTLHSLRHSFATNCIQRGMDFKLLAYTIGDKLETVISTYAHVNTDMQKMADDILSGKDLTKSETVTATSEENQGSRS